MNNYTITSEIRGTEQFLVIRQEQEQYLNDYLLKMLEYNSIPGILPLKSQNMNGSTVLFYQVGDRYKLTELIKQGRIGSNEAKLIYTRLIDAVVGMGEYFLNADQCVYDVEYLYVDSTLNPGMLYLPFEDVRNSEVNKAWKDFFLSLLSYLADGKQDPFYDKIMRYLIQPNFNLNEFRGFVAESANNSAPQIESMQEQLAPAQTPMQQIPGQMQGTPMQEQSMQNQMPPMPNAMPQAVPAMAKPAKPAKSAKPAKQAAPAPAAPSIAIPGMPKPAPTPAPMPAPTPMPIPGAAPMPAPQKPVKEKKQGSLFGFGKKKEEKPAPMPMPVPGAAPMPAPGNVPMPGAAPTPGNAPQAAGGWTPTLFIKPAEPAEEKRTVMLSAAPHLMYQDVYISMEQFPFTIGKGSSSYIVANNTVSRLHVTITQQADGFYVQDEASSNGTWLNGQRLAPKTPMQLHDGDHLKLSTEEFTFHTR